MYTGQKKREVDRFPLKFDEGGEGVEKVFCEFKQKDRMTSLPATITTYPLWRKQKGNCPAASGNRDKPANDEGPKSYPSQGKQPPEERILSLVKKYHSPAGNKG